MEDQESWLLSWSWGHRSHTVLGKAPIYIRPPTCASRKACGPWTMIRGTHGPRAWDRVHTCRMGSACVGCTVHVHGIVCDPFLNDWHAICPYIRILRGLYVANMISRTFKVYFFHPNSVLRIYKIGQTGWGPCMIAESFLWCLLQIFWMRFRFLVERLIRRSWKCVFPSCFFSWWGCIFHEGSKPFGHSTWL